jgi:Flp pilus assembly protein TadD
MSNKVEGAQQDLQAAVALDDSLWRAWNALGSGYDRRRQWDEARAAYDKALRIRPEAPVVLNNLGVSLMLQERYAEAEAVFRRAISLQDAGSAASVNLVLSLAWQGLYEEALSNAGMEARSVTLNNVGYVAMMRGDYAQASTYLSQAIQLSPRYYATPEQNLARLQLLMGKDAEVPPAATAAGGKPK